MHCNLQTQSVRVQVCRAACGAISACAEAIGKRFEPVALYVLSELYRTVVGSIQVMSDAADACLSQLVGAVHSPALLAKITDTLTKDKSNKLRACCARYLLKVLREWPQAAYRGQQAAVRDAIKRAIGDATPGAPCPALPHYRTNGHVVEALGASPGVEGGKGVFPTAQAAQRCSTLDRTCQWWHVPPPRLSLIHI